MNLNMNTQRLLLILHNRSFWKSIFSGGITAVADLTFLFLFHEILGWSQLVAVNISFILAILVNFSLQKFWTFSNKDLKVAHKQFIKFLGVSAINLAMNAIFMFFFVAILGLWYIGAQAFVIAVLAIMNFILYRIFVFK